MYFYIFDGFLQEPKYRTEITRIENRLATLGIQGRNEKITILKNIREATLEAMKRGAATVVAVGNDQTIGKILGEVIDQKAVLGLIPVGEPQMIATYFGISRGVAACDILSRRVIRKIDVGRANTHYFLLNAAIPFRTPVECDGKYTVEPNDDASAMSVVNLGTDGHPGNPEDGRLELTVTPPTAHSLWRRSETAPSVFPIKQAKIAYRDQNDTVVLDGQTVVKCPVTIEVAPKRLSVIVGRERTF